MIRKLETYVLAFADVTVLWLWNTFGIKHSQQLMFLTLLLLAVSAFYFSHGGVDYGLLFWLLWPLGAMIFTMICISNMVLPSDRRNAVQAARRANGNLAYIRWILLGVAVAINLLPPYVNTGPSVAYWTAWFSWDLWTDAMSPTKPRKRRRVTVPALQGSI